jgi:UDP-2-acetamido-2,6-beta-L-arabino-hexul-4-ose reductase
LRNKKIKIFDEKEYVNLYYIDDLLNKFVKLIKSNKKENFPKIDKIDKIKVIDIAKKIKQFSISIRKISLNNLNNRVSKNLYSTYVSFLTKKFFSLKLNSQKDKRGEFVEFIKLKNFGQISYFTINEKQERGGHYHNSKVEQFLILKGSAKIKYINLFDKKVNILKINDKNMKIFRTMPGYVHTIINTGKSKLIGIVWANEIFDIKKPDTIRYYE